MTTTANTTNLGSKLDSNETIFKRLIEQLKFDRVAEEDWYEKKSPASFSFSIGDTGYSIFYNDNGKYIIVSNFKGGCSLSRKQSEEMDLDNVFTKFQDKYDDIKRDSMNLRNSERIYSYFELVAMGKIPFPRS